MIITRKDLKSYLTADYKAFGFKVSYTCKIFMERERNNVCLCAQSQKIGILYK